MDLIFKSPTDKIWIDIYRCPDLVERMLLDDGGAGVSPDNAGVWHLSITFTRQSLLETARRLQGRRRIQIIKQEQSGHGCWLMLLLQPAGAPTQTCSLL